MLFSHGFNKCPDAEGKEEVGKPPCWPTRVSEILVCFCNLSPLSPHTKMSIWVLW